MYPSAGPSWPLLIYISLFIKPFQDMPFTCPVLVKPVTLVFENEPNGTVLELVTHQHILDFRRRDGSCMKLELENTGCKHTK